MRSHFKVYFDFDSKTEQLTEEEQARLLLAMFRYAKDGEIPVLSGNERFLFPVFKAQIDSDIKAYEAKVTNGCKGGRPVSEVVEEEPEITERNLNKPNETEIPKKEERRKKKEDIEKETLINECKEKKVRFVPPAVEEVEAYCKERNNGINAQVFVDFYASKGWKIGKERMQNWKAAVRTWENKRKESGQASVPTKKVAAQDYSQRDYENVQTSLEENQRKRFEERLRVLRNEQVREQEG